MTTFGGRASRLVLLHDLTCLQQNLHRTVRHVIGAARTAGHRLENPFEDASLKSALGQESFAGYAVVVVVVIDILPFSRRPRPLFHHLRDIAFMPYKTLE